VKTVTVVTDSAASIPQEMVAALGIVVIPMSVILGNTIYRDGQLGLDEVMARVDEGLSTSGANTGEILQTLEAIEGDVLLLTISRQMSSTHAASVIAGNMVGERVRVLDSCTAAGAQGLVVLAAAEAAAQGEDIDGVIAKAQRVIGHVRLIATVENLSRLIASGRVPGIAALANRWLGMNPLFQFREGHAHALRPAFSRDAALDRIVASWRQSVVPGATLRVAALHAEAEDDAARILKQVTAEVTPATAFVAPFSSVMVVHVGLGLVGLAWHWDE
jgi:DegV family protein with EDD domain